MSEVTFTDVRSEKFQDTIKGLASRGVMVGALLFFLLELHSGVVMSFDPKVTTTAQVVFQAIIPLSFSSCSSYATVMNDNKACYPDKMVSHAWENLFINLIASIVANMSGEGSYWDYIPHLSSKERVKALINRLPNDILVKRVWLCIFGVNQHVSICRCHDVKYLNDNPLCEMDKFDKMLAFLFRTIGSSFAQLLALDTYGAALRRAWVVSEVATCMSLGIIQEVGVYFPVKIGNPAMRTAVKRLNVRNCEASRPEDKTLILNAIADKDEYNRKVQEYLREALDEGDFFGWMLVHFVMPGILALCSVYSFVLMVHFVKTAFIERALLILLPCTVATVTFGCYGVFRHYYGGFLKSFLAADDIGMCHEICSHVPPGPLWSKPFLCFYRQVAWACRSKPCRCRWIGLGITLSSCGVAGAIWSPLILSGFLFFNDNPDKWHFIFSWTCVPLIFPFGLCGLDLYYNLLHKKIVGILMFLVICITSTCMASYMIECWDQKALRWKLSPFFKVFNIADCCTVLAICLQPFMLKLFSALERRFLKIFPSERVHVEPKSHNDEFLGIKLRIHTSVERWSRISLRLTGIPEDATKSDLDFLLSPFKPVAVFQALGSDMRSLGRATVSFQSEHAVRSAVTSLNGVKFQGSVLNAKWIWRETQRTSTAWLEPAPALIP